MNKKKHPIKATSVFEALLIGVLLTALSSAQATTNDWVGGGADGFTYTTGNWQTNGVAGVPPWTTDIARWNIVPFTKAFTNNANMNMGELYIAATQNNPVSIFGSGSSKTISLYGINGIGIQIDSGSAAVACSSTLSLAVASNQIWTNNASLSVNCTIASTTNFPSTQLTVDGTGTNTFSGWITDKTTTNKLSVVKNGSGVLTLPTFTGAPGNSFSGGLTLNSGTLNINATNALGAGSVTINGGTIDSTVTGGVTVKNPVTYYFANNFFYGGSKALGLGAANTVNLLTNCTITGSNFNWLTISGPVNGNFSLTRDGSGCALVMSGSGNYSGGTIVRNSNGGQFGALYLGADNPLGTGPLTFTNPPSLFNNSGIIIASLNTSARLLTNAVILADGPVLGDTSQNGALTFSGPIQLAGSAQLALNIKSPVTFSGNIGGTAGLIKTGGSTLTISGNCTYPLGTIINSGTLALSAGALLTNTPTITVGNSAVFDVTGLTTPFTLAKSLSSQILSNSAPGAIINGTNNCSAGTISLVYDGVNPAFNLASGGMTLSAATTIRVNNTGAQLAIGSSYKLIANAGTGLVAGAVTSGPVTVGGNGAAGNATLAITGGELFLNVAAAAPSPATLTNSVSGNSMVLDWPTGQGWILQSNSVSLSDTNSWYPVTGATPPATVVIDPVKPAVFYRLKY